MRQSWVGALWGSVLVALATVPACDDSSTPDDGEAGTGDVLSEAGNDAGGAATGGAGASKAGGAGGVADVGGAGGVADVGGAGGAQALCECIDDGARAPLECACAIPGVCPAPRPPESKLETIDSNHYGWPWVVLFGTCESGHQVLTDSEACENGSRTVWDAQGNFVYSSHGPYGSAPSVCSNDLGFGNFGIGESDPSEGCSYCVVAWQDDDGMTGAAGGGAIASCIEDQVRMNPPCPEELYE